MSAQIILMSHVAFGLLGILAAMWIFVEVLNVTYRNKDRIRYMSMAVAVFVWASFLLGGYWYMTYYGGDRGIIKAGP